jgi:hypothetical protein
MDQGSLTEGEVDLLVSTSLDQLKLYFSIYTKQSILISGTITQWSLNDVIFCFLMFFHRKF